METHIHSSPDLMEISDIAHIELGDSLDVSKYKQSGL